MSVEVGRWARLAGSPRGPALLMRPEVLKMPWPMARYDDPFLPWGKGIIEGTHDVVSAYVFDLAAYLALGAAGAVALERTIAYAMAGHDALTVLHGPFASAEYLRAASDNAFNVDGVTVTDAALISAYVGQHGAGVFVIGTMTQPASHSVYDPAAGHLIVRGAQPVSLHVAGEAALYASAQEDFAEAARAALVALREQQRQE